MRYFNLNSNNLTGSLPESIRELSSLEELHLRRNSMIGVIRESHFRNPSHLQILRPNGGNHFSMKLNSDWNPPFQLIGMLDISYCNVGPNFPKWIITQTNISELDLSNAGISGSLRHNFGDLLPTGLETIVLSTDQIHGKTPNLSTTRLIHVYLSTDRFAGAEPLFPPTLQVVDLSHNMFSEPLSSICASSFGAHSSLNKLSGKLPSSLGNLVGIFVLRLHENNFSRELPSLENCTDLQMVDLGDNNLSGIEIEFGRNLEGMRSIDMSSNYLVGEISESIASMTELKSLNLSRNHLTGKLPEDFGNMKNLESLDLSRNYFIPASFSRFNIS
ncbi:receptor-like protein EIX1 [Argentina anserina]|uniref:receptor-like protein EIX1 n=1 Tax=Argentina anserina TaxID=57926 RepID=UPI0021767544|nr:receptor-like protein EIX1 [Potentilla anserina]